MALTSPGRAQPAERRLRYAPNVPEFWAAGRVRKQARRPSQTDRDPSAYLWQLADAELQPSGDQILRKQLQDEAKTV